MTKLTVARALTARVARRAVFLATVMAAGIFGLIVLIAAGLAYFFSGWWWVLVLPFAFLLSLFLVARLLIILLIRQIHGNRMTKAQTEALDGFVDKIQQLLEARATPPPIFVAITIKDLVIHRDITTIKKLIADTAGLRRDYDALEKLF